MPEYSYIAIQQRQKRPQIGDLNRQKSYQMFKMITKEICLLIKMVEADITMNYKKHRRKVF
jgi:hypothetical protein